MNNLSRLKIDLNILLEEAQRGSRSSAYELIHQLNKQLKESPGSIPQPVFDWLASSLMDIVFNNVSGKKALGVTGKSKLHDPNHIIHLTVQQVYWHIKTSGLPLHKSETSHSAFADAAEKFQISMSTAEKYYYFADEHYTFIDNNFLRDEIGLTDDEIQQQSSSCPAPNQN